jgi:hypothetical protein
MTLLTELGHDVFSIGGAYANPAGHPSLPRPSIQGAVFHEDWFEESQRFARTDVPKEFFDKFDLIIVMHTPEVIIQNWPRMKHKPVIWRSIGQSVPSIEGMLKSLRDEGLKIVRYSPKEKQLPEYIGADAMIRFYKDEDEWTGWVGSNPRAINFTQSLKGRRFFCHHDDVLEMISGFPAKIFGSGNEDLGNLNGGELTYENQKGQLKENRLMVYGGTWPACYTLSFMEAWMMGIPVVAVGKRIAENLRCPHEHLNFYEVHEMISNGIDGFCSDNVGELRAYIQQLLDNYDLATKIGKAGRAKAIDFFGKSKIKKEWNDFLIKL